MRLRLGIGLAVTKLRLMPIALSHCLSPHCILIKPPFAGCPLNNLICCTAEITCHPAFVAIILQVAASQAIALCIDIGMVCLIIIRAWLPGTVHNIGSAPFIAWQLRTWGKCGKVSSCCLLPVFCSCCLLPMFCWGTGEKENKRKQCDKEKKRKQTPNFLM